MERFGGFTRWKEKNKSKKSEENEGGTDDMYQRIRKLLILRGVVWMEEYNGTVLEYTVL